MKKIFTYLAVAALMAVACDDMYGPVETPTTPDKAGSVEIQIDTLGDDTLAFTLIPEEGASYFSYLVAEGPAESLDSMAVYQCKAGGMIKGTFLASEVADTTLTLGGLSPDTPYTIYAVAGSPQGIPGSVAVKEVVTPDGITIAITDFKEVTDSSVVLSFSEKVFLGEGEITATYYAVNLGMQAMGTVKAVADSIIVDGNTVTVQFEGLPHGAYYTVSYPEGMFTDSVKNKIKALSSSFSAEEGAFSGIYSRKDTVAFALEAQLPEEQQMFSDWQTARFSVGTAVDSTLADTGKGKVVAEYHTPGKVISIDMVLNQHYMFGESGVGMICPEAPAFGTTIVFSFQQDAFQDIWGNPTKAVEYATLCAYDYTIDDIIGTFAFTAPDNVTQSYVDGSFVIEASDDPEKGNVMITTFAGIPCMAPIYATFTPESGSLELYGMQVFYEYVDDAGTPDDTSDDAEVWYVFYTYTYDYLHLTMPEAGVLTSPDDYFGIAIAVNGTLSQWAALYLDFNAELVSVEESVPTALSNGIVKFSKTLPLNVR